MSFDVPLAKKAVASDNITEAPTCTAGPPKPTDARESKPMSGKNIFPKAILKEISLVLSFRLLAISSAVLTCGMPLRSLPGKKRKVIHAVNPIPIGGMTK